MTTFRPRPVDIEQKLPILITDEKEFVESTADLDRRGSAVKLGRHSVELNGVSDLDVQDEDVVTPSFRFVGRGAQRNSDLPKDPTYIWKRPTNYIEYTKKTAEEWDKKVEYDLDSEDEEFLATYNNENKKPLSDDLCERLIDALEKEYFKQRLEKGLSSDDSDDDEEDVPCCICNDGDYSDKNLIVFCDGCDVAVHQQCYGIQSIPKGDWFCAACDAMENGEEEDVVCCLCPVRGGALKKTTDGRWIHIVCALWIPEIKIDDNNIDLSKIDKGRFDLTCCVCKEQTGACVQCKDKACFVAFHPLCGRRKGLFVEIKQGKRGSIFSSYCRKHSETHFAEKEEKKKASQYREKVILEGDHKKLFSKAVLTSRKLAKVKPEVLEAVYAYWAKKRTAAGRPLLKRLEMDMLQKRPKNQRRRRRLRDYLEMKKCRQGMEIARLLLDLVGKREREKLRLMETARELFEQELSDITGEPKLVTQSHDEQPMVSAPDSPTKNDAKKRKWGEKGADPVANGPEIVPIVPVKRKRGRPPSRKRLLMEAQAAKLAAAGLANGDGVSSEGAGGGGKANGKNGVNSKKRKRENGSQPAALRKATTKFKRAKNGTHRDLNNMEEEDEVDPLLSVEDNGKTKPKRTREADKKDGGVRKRRRQNGKTVNGKHVTKRRTKKEVEPESGEEDENTAQTTKTKEKEKESVLVKRGRGRPGRPKKKDKEKKVSVGEKKKKAQVKSRGKKEEGGGRASKKDTRSDQEEEEEEDEARGRSRTRKPSQRIQKSKEKAERLQKWKAMTKRREQRHTNRKKRRQSR